MLGVFIILCGVLEECLLVGLGVVCSSSSKDDGILSRESSLPLSSGDVPKSPEPDIPIVLGVNMLDVSLPEEDPSDAEDTICFKSSSSNAVFTSACRKSSRKRCVLVPAIAIGPAEACNNSRR